MYLSASEHALPWGFAPVSSSTTPTEATPTTMTTTVDALVPEITPTETTTPSAALQTPVPAPQDIPTILTPETTISTEPTISLGAPATTEQPVVQKGYLFVNLHKLRAYLKFEFEHLHLYDWGASNANSKRQRDIKREQRLQKQEAQQEVQHDSESQPNEQEAATVSNFEKYPWTFFLPRIINDFIFLSTFVGNDFLPALPTLDIEGKSCFLQRMVILLRWRS